MSRYSGSVLLGSMLLGLMLVGCSSQDISEARENLYNNDRNIDIEAYYIQDVASNFVYENLEAAVHRYDVETDKGVFIDYKQEDSYFDYSRLDFSYSYLDVDKAGRLLLNNKIVNQLEEELTPGIKTFIQDVCKETEDISPKSMVINNNFMVMHPIHLYTPYQYDWGYPLMVGLNDFKIKSPYLKLLIQAVDTSKFVVQEPVVTGEGVILQLATPFYIQGSGFGYEVSTMEDRQNARPTMPNMSFRLYIKEDKVQEIHMIVTQNGSEAIGLAMLTPMITWAKEEWRVDEATASDIEEMLKDITAGKLTKSKGTIGSCQYSYDVQKRKYDDGRMMEFVIKPND